MTNQLKHRIHSVAAGGTLRLIAAAVLVAAVFCAEPAFAANKDMIQLQTQVQQLQDAVARLQQSNDERMGVLKDLVQQSADSVNKMAAGLDAVQRQMQTQQEAQGGKIDQVSGQIQSLNDSLDEVKARIGGLEKLLQSVQSQQQSMSANIQNGPSAGGSGGSPAATGTTPLPETAPTNDAPPAQPAPIVRRGKPSAGTPLVAEPPPDAAAGAPAAPASTAPPADDLYKTALGDYMAAKYALSSSEFGDVVKFYPDNPLSGNSYYYMAEIEYRGGHYENAIKNYDSVLQQYPDSNKVPVSHLHKGMAQIALKQNDAGIRELRSLIQRFPNSPEAMQARSKLSGMSVPVTPKH
jgi:tol-pal system protein YbgF